MFRPTGPTMLNVTILRSFIKNIYIWRLFYETYNGKCFQLWSFQLLGNWGMEPMHLLLK